MIHTLQGVQPHPTQPLGDTMGRVGRVQLASAALGILCLCEFAETAHMPAAWLQGASQLNCNG